MYSMIHAHQIIFDRRNLILLCFYSTTEIYSILASYIIKVITARYLSKERWLGWAFPQ